MNEQLNQEIEAVEIVDTLMTYFRNGARPNDDILLRAYELDINVKQLELYMTIIEGEPNNEDADEEW